MMAAHVLAAHVLAAHVLAAHVRAGGNFDSTLSTHSIGHKCHKVPLYQVVA